MKRGCAAHVRPLGVKWKSMMVSASNERMPVSAGSAGLRIDAAIAGLPPFLGVSCNLAAGSPVDVGALSSNTGVKVRFQSL